VPITHLIVERLLDRSDLLSRLVEIDGGTPDRGWAQRSFGHTDEVRHPEPGSRSPKVSGSPGFR
jgi:error-prone DNA polymerase